MTFYSSRFSWLIPVFLILLNACSSGPSSFNKKSLFGEIAPQNSLEESPENSSERESPFQEDHSLEEGNASNNSQTVPEENPNGRRNPPTLIPLPSDATQIPSSSNKIPGSSPFDRPQGQDREESFNQAFARTDLSRQIVFYDGFENLNSNFNNSGSYFSNALIGVFGKAASMEDLNQAGSGNMTLIAEGREIQKFTQAQKNDEQYIRECRGHPLPENNNTLAPYEATRSITVDLHDISELIIHAKVRGKGSVFGAARQIKFFDEQGNQLQLTQRYGTLSERVNLNSCDGEFQNLEGRINLSAFFQRRKEEREVRIPVRASLVLGLNIIDGSMVQLKNFKVSPNQGASVFEENIRAPLPFSFDFFFKADPLRMPLPAHSEIASFQLGENRFEIKLEGNNLVITGRNGAIRLSHPLTLDPYFWTQVGFTLSPREIRLWVNGENVAHQAGEFAGELHNWSWGRFSDATPGFPGMIDEFRVYQGVLADFCRTCAIDETGILPIAQEAYQFKGPQYQPLDENIANSLRIKAAPNEYEAASFALYSEKNWENAKLRVSDLRGPGVIPAQEVDIRVVGFWKQMTRSKINNVSFGEGPIAKMTNLAPELLLYDENDTQNLKGETRFANCAEDPSKKCISWPLMQNKEHFKVDLRAFKRSQFVATVHVNSNVAPGTYSGSIDVLQNNQSIKRIPLHVEVLNIRLPDTREIPQIFSLYYGSNFIPGVQQVSSERYLVETEDIRNHGMNMLNIDLMDNSGSNYDPNNADLGYNQAIQRAQNLRFKYVLFGRCVQSKNPKVNWGPYDKAKQIFSDVFCYAQDEPDSPGKIQGEISTVARIHNKWTLQDERNFGNIQDRNALRDLLHRIPENERPKAASAIQKEYQLRMSDPQSRYLSEIPESHCVRTNANGQNEYYPVATLFDCPAFKSFPALMNRLGNPTWRDLGMDHEKLDLPILSMFLKSPFNRFDGVEQRNVMVDYVKTLLQKQDRQQYDPAKKEIIYYPPAYDEEAPVARIYNGIFPWLTRLNGTIPYAYYHPDYTGCKANMEQAGEFERCRQWFQQNEQNANSLTNDPFDDFDSIDPGSLGDFGENRGDGLLYLMKDEFLVYPADILNPRGERVPTIIPTINWELLREGIDDYRYLLAFCKKLKPQLDYGACPFDPDIQRALDPLLNSFTQAWMAELNQPTDQDTPFRGMNVKNAAKLLPEMRKGLIQLLMR